MTQLKPWESLLEGLPDPTICFDDTGAVLYGNTAACRLLGRAPADFAGTSLRHLLAAGTTAPPFTEYDPSGAPVRSELVLTRKDGSRVPTECTTLALPLMPGSTLHCLVLRDLRGRTLPETPVRELNGHSVIHEPEPAFPTNPELKFRRLFHSAPIGAIFWNREGKVLEVNECFLRLIGYSREEFVRDGFQWDALTPHEHAFADAAAFRQLLSTGHCTPYEKELIHKDGTRIPVQFSCALLDPASSDHIFAYVVDLTQRHRVENELRKCRERFDIAVQTTRDGVWEWDLVTGEVYHSARWFEIQGYSGREAGLDTSFDAWFERIHPDYRDYVKTRLQLHLDKGLPYEVVYLHFHASGEYRWQRAAGQAIWDRQGKPLKMVGSISDIMHQKLVEEEALREKDLSDSIINSLPGIFYLIDANGCLVRWNGNLEAITGFRPDELDASTLPFISLPQGLSAGRLLEHVFAQGEMTLDAALLTRSGDTIPYYFYGVVILHEERPHLIGMAIDMSVQRKTEKLLTESVAQIRELASHLQDARETERSAMAHEIHDELGQSLTAIKMDLAKMLRKHSLSPETEEGLTQAIASIDGSISSVRRIASNLRPRILDDLGLPAAIEWYSECFARRSELEVTCSINCPDLETDARTSIALFRILQESLTNVLRHARAQRVDIALTASGSMLTLSIADDGQGFQMEEARKKHTLGVLGLKERTLTLGGSFCVSTAPGAGTRIQVQVPITPQ